MPCRTAEVHRSIKYTSRKHNTVEIPERRFRQDSLYYRTQIK
jgi:hypothetical protein